MGFKLRLPWSKPAQPQPAQRPDPATCTHPRAEVEMHGTAIKRRWCAVCGAELPIPQRQ